MSAEKKNEMLYKTVGELKKQIEQQKKINLT